jgi:hypothetical protein
MSSSNKGVLDYSKWDRMEFSDDDDEEQHELQPRITRLEEPSRVTARHDGTLWVESSSSSSSSSSSLVTTPAGSWNAPRKNGSELKRDGDNNDITVAHNNLELTKKQIEWTQHGAKTTLGGTDLYWSQDRCNVVLRIGLPSTCHGKDLSVTLSGTIWSYADRHSASGDQRAMLKISIKSTKLFSSRIFYPIHYSEEDDDDAGEVDWSIDYLGKDRFITIALHKAVPMYGVTLWWRRPFEDMEEVDIERNSDQKKQSQLFMETWDEAHRLFRSKIASGELPNMQPTNRDDNVESASP